MNKLELIYKCKACGEKFTVKHTTTVNNLEELLKYFLLTRGTEFHLCMGLMWEESLMGIGELIEGRLILLEEDKNESTD